MNLPAVSLGDLLRALHATDAEQWPSVTAAFGWPERRTPLPSRDESISDFDVVDDFGNPPSERAGGTGKVDLEKDTAHPLSLVRQMPPQWVDSGSVPTEDEFDRVLDMHAPDRIPLCRPGQVASYLRRHLALRRPGREIDVHHVVKRFAKRLPVTTPQFKEVVRWPLRVQMIYDRSQALLPCRADMRTLAQQIARTFGPRLRLSVVDGMPCTSSTEGPGSAGPTFDGSPLVVLGSAGMEQRDGAVHEQWCALGRRLHAAGSKAILLAPLPQRSVSRETSTTFETVLLDAGRPMRALRSGGLVPEGGAFPSSSLCVDTLRAALHGNPWTTPAALRELRLSLQAIGVPLDIGSEAELWRDPDVSSHELACAVRMEARERVADAFRSMPETLRCKVAEIQWKHLRSASALVRAEYARAVSPLVPHGSTASASLAAGLGEALHLTRRVCMALRRSDAPWTAGLAAYIGRMCLRSTEVLKDAEDALHAAWVLAHRRELAAEIAALPKGLRLHSVLWALAPVSETLQGNLTGRATRPRESARTGESTQAVHSGLEIPPELMNLLYRQGFSGKLITYFIMKGSDRDTALDLSQDVVLKAIRRFSQYRGEGTLTNWLLAIADNAFLDTLAGRRREVLLDHPTLTELADSMHEVAADTSRRDFEAELHRALRRFERDHPKQAEALRLSHLEGWSVQQMAVEMQRTPGATREFLLQARKRFRPYVAHLREYLGD